MRNLHLFVTNVAVRSGIYVQASYTIVIYSSDLFAYNAKYFQALSGEKWRSFANSLRSMLKCRSTVNEVAWEFNKFGIWFWTDVWPGHF